ncbi:MAG: cadherin-like beta sandwich domain-containing protein, partial [bacterium]
FAAARGAFTRASTEHADTPLDKTERNQFLNFAQGMSEDITITVTAEDASTTEYTLTVTRAAPPPPSASTDATLSALSLTGITFTPAFAADTTDYTATVINDVVSTTITAMATDDGATVTYNTPDDTDGNTADAAVELVEGDNEITITVTAEDTTTTETYTITVTRAEPELPTLTIAADAAAFTEDPNGAAATFTVTSDIPAPDGGLAVTVTLTGADDFVDNTTTTADIAAGERTGTASFTIINDETREDDVTATATIGDSDDYLGGGATATATINDNEPTLTIVADAETFTEGTDASADFTVTASPAPSSELPVVVTLTGAETFITATRTQTITITAGATTKMASFAITPDADNESSATATATINANAAAYNLGLPPTATATAIICDDDDGDALQDPQCSVTSISAATAMAVAHALPAVVAVITSNVAGAISDRVDAVNDGDGDFNLRSLSASFATQGATAMANGAELESVIGDGVKRLLDGKTHSLALSGGGGVGGAGVWVGGAYQDLGGEEKALDWDGDLYSVQLGADARLNNGALAGAAVSWSEAEWDYENVGDDSSDPVEGVIELSTTSVHPYLAWRRASGMDVWASVGYGEGDLDAREKTGAERASGDVELRSATLGVASGDYAVGVASALRLKFDAQVANTEVDYDDATTDLDLASRRVRVGMEFGGAATNGTRRAFELGARYDGGDVRSGVGAEVGARLAHDNGDGMSASLNARALLAHGGEHDEWGISGTLRYASGADG